MATEEDEIARLRENGLTPKAIARRLGLRPAQVQQVLQILARRNAPATETPGRFLGAWVNAGWSMGLAIAEGRHAWRAFDTRRRDGLSFQGGFAQVLVAREARYGDVSVCGWLVDVWCLGVKDTMGPRIVEPEELEALVKVYFAAFDAAGPISLDLAQALVLGGVEYARSLGFAPASGFARTASHLGADIAPTGLTFGREGRPAFVAGPRDPVHEVVEHLRTRLGDGAFDADVRP